MAKRARESNEAGIENYDPQAGCPISGPPGSRSGGTAKIDEPIMRPAPVTPEPTPFSGKGGK